MIPGSFVVAPGVKRAISIELADYLESGSNDSLSGEPVWFVPTGVTLESSLLNGTLAVGIVSPSQEGIDYLVICAVEFTSGASEQFSAVIQCRTGDADPRLS